MPRALLSAAFVKSAVCPDGLKKVDFFDSEQRGFMLEVRRSGGKTYYQRYTDERGRERQFKIGPADVLSLTMARRKARTAAAEALVGSDPQERRAEMRTIPTLAELVRDRYLPHVKSYKRSWCTDETVLRIHILPALGFQYVDLVRAEPIAALVERMREKGYATGTTNRVVIVLRHIFNLARKWRVPGVGENPTAGINLAPDVKRERFLSLEEAQHLIASIEQDENQVAAKAIMLLLLTGARRNEITHARWDYLDWEKRTLLVPLAKSGKPRSIALNAAAIELLRSIPRLDLNPYILPSPLTGEPSPSLFFPWQRIRTRAGLPDLRLHDLRHSFASFLVNKGVSLYVVQGLLGHAHTKYTQRYAHLTPDTLRDAAETVASVIAGAGAPTQGASSI
ncbi:site-specific integrase [Rhodoplanes sp. Z2-YC6860]|uniref:site-specific integrase n=1 Tax=Rhodoplanes sp. Z2-YC6860 TaxID=674703 RepID=UPI00078CBA68|nr:site-specific integrase [Rhodoplanes sp. Z2-YC6860]AMN42105.1 Phage integrase [Rhodoplanes sp. Z2-YC6860]